MQTSTHLVTVGDTEVRKEFVADHEAEREWGCLSDPAYELADHAAAGSGSWHRNPAGTTEDQAAHFMALVGHH